MTEAPIPPLVPAEVDLRQVERLLHTIFRTARVAPEERLHRPPAVAIYRGGQGEDMATLSYKEQLLHPNWQRKRLEVLSRADFKCECCFGGDVTLHVHHKRYVKGRLAWEYEADQLVALCADCHSDFHDQNEELNEVLSSMASTGPGSINEIIALVGGYLANGSAEPSDPLAFYAGEVAERFNRLAGWSVFDMLSLSNALADCGKSFLPLLREAIERAQPDPPYRSADDGSGDAA